MHNSAATEEQPLAALRKHFRSPCNPTASLLCLPLPNIVLKRKDYSPYSEVWTTKQIEITVPDHSKVQPHHEDNATTKKCASHQSTSVTSRCTMHPTFLRSVVRLCHRQPGCANTTAVIPEENNNRPGRSCRWCFQAGLGAAARRAQPPAQRACRPTPPDSSAGTGCLHSPPPVSNNPSLPGGCRTCAHMHGAHCLHTPATSDRTNRPLQGVTHPYCQAIAKLNQVRNRPGYIRFNPVLPESLHSALL